MNVEEPEVGNIPVSKIDMGKRYREEYGDIKDLKLSIQTEGLIQPIAVMRRDEDYLLLAGGRRLTAIKELKWENVNARIYPPNLSELRIRSIELEENFRRKDLTFIEDVKLKQEIHRLQISIHGEKISKLPDAPGWSVRDTAKLIGKSHPNVISDLKLANAMEAMPDIDWSKCKTRKDAIKILDKFEETVIRQDLAEKATNLLGRNKKQMMDSYVVGNCIDLIKGMPSKSINLVEIDPPYAIDLQKAKKIDNYESVYQNNYNEIEGSEFLTIMKTLLDEAYRVMTDNSWLICWFAPEPWFDIVYHLIISAGFKTRRMCGIWRKPNGQTKHPEIYLANNYEMFFYASKGNARINLDSQGKNSIFDHAPVPPQVKTHPTEKPVSLYEDLLKTFAWESSRILVPFAGSGNMLRAAYNCKMFPIGYDLSQRYKEAYLAKLLEDNHD